MKIEAKYFGVIAELIGCKDEKIDLDFDGEFNLRDFFEKKYPKVTEVNYKIAVNQQITDNIQSTDGEAEVALLPPFAGG
ncbi:MAG: MoaD/ThiS family protein [Fluviicola sp.]|nr:MoaD/ThiS family protein [Fluviicola sp.]